MEIYAIFSTEENIIMPDPQNCYDVCVHLVPGSSKNDAINNLLDYCNHSPFATIIGATKTSYAFDNADFDSRLRSGSLNESEIEIIENLVRIARLDILD